MTWTKTGTEFPGQCADDALSDAAYRTHHEAISWLYSVEKMSLRIPKRLVRRFAASDDYADACLELVIVGYWKDRGAEWEIIHHANVIRQSIGAQLAIRERDRQRKRSVRKRPRNGEDVHMDSRTDNHTGVPMAVTPDADRQTGTSLSVSEVEVRAHSNGQKAHRGESDLTAPRTDLGETS